MRTSSLICLLALLLGVAPAAAQTVTMGETAILSAPDNGNGNLLLAQQATLSGSAKLESLAFYVTGAAGSLVLGVYDSTGPSGHPGHLLAQTAEFAPATGWNVASTTTTPTLAAGKYWLAYFPSDSGLSFVKENNTGNCRYYALAFTATLPQTFKTTTNNCTPTMWSFYATLSTTATPTLSLTDRPVNPSLTDNSVSGTSVTALTAKWSDGSQFTGNYGFTTPYNNDNNLFALNKNNVVLSGSLAGLAGTTQNVTVDAQQGSTSSNSINVPIAVTSSTPPPPPPPTSSDASASWKVSGMLSVGGIPNRATACATITPLGSGQNDSANIQAAIDACPNGQVVMLNPGTFIVNNLLLIHSSITLRGSGAGVTILNKTNGATPRTNTVVSGTIATGGPLNNHIYMPNSQSPADSEPIIVIGQARYPGPDNTTSQNLTADGAQGSSSVTIANAANFAAGHWVLLDEISKWSYVPVPPGYDPSGVQVKAGDHVVFQMHNPGQPVDDPPDAFGWFSRGYPSGVSSPSDTDGRMTSEIKEIASVNGNTVTFTTPLTIGYRVSHLAQLTRYTVNGRGGGNGGIQITNAGVENLTMKGGSDGSLRFEVTAYCWAKDVEITQWLGEGIAIDNGFRDEIRGSYIYTGSDPTPGGGGYAISLASGSSEILIEDNISRDVNKVMVDRSSGAGSVVAYNYMDDGWISYSPTWQEIGLNASHMAGPHHVLFEGNYGFNMDSDYTHGSSQYITHLRNYTTGQRGSWTGPDANSRTAGVSAWAKSFVFIGNIFGRPGQMTGWSYTDPMMGCDANGSNCAGGISGSWGSGGIGNIWQIGYDATNQWTEQAEMGALSTVIRDGNYDFLTNSQRWHNTPGGFSIPNSLYLASKPAFFGNNAWPWVDPTTGALYTLPAKARYDAGTPVASP